MSVTAPDSASVRFRNGYEHLSRPAVVTTPDFSMDPKTPPRSSSLRHLLEPQTPQERHAQENFFKTITTPGASAGATDDQMKDLVFRLHQQLESQRRTTDEVLTIIRRDAIKVKREKAEERRQRLEDNDRAMAEREWARLADREEKDRLLANHLLEQDLAREEREAMAAEQLWRAAEAREELVRRVAADLARIDAERAAERAERLEAADRALAERTWVAAAHREEQDRLMAQQMIEREEQRAELEVRLAQHVLQREADRLAMEERLEQERAERQEDMDCMLAEQLVQRLRERTTTEQSFSDRLKRMEADRLQERHDQRREMDRRLHELEDARHRERVEFRRELEQRVDAISQAHAVQFENQRVQIRSMHHQLERKTATIWFRNGTIVGMLVGGVFVILCVTVAPLALGIAAPAAMAAYFGMLAGGGIAGRAVASVTHRRLSLPTLSGRRGGGRLYNNPALYYGTDHGVGGGVPSRMAALPAAAQRRASYEDDDESTPLITEIPSTATTPQSARTQRGARRVAGLSPSRGSPTYNSGLSQRLDSPVRRSSSRPVWILQG
eukprot:m.204590 g.204590  ORF g.204590 m.204590 type:complete len:558 (+) comp22583_c0_seq1:40-1713(+)